jgi:hypothetical protein
MRPGFVPAFFLPLLFLSGFAACNGQSEGDVCDPLNGNNDCQNGYECTTIDLPPGIAGHGARCCPGYRPLATTYACGGNQGGPGASTAAPSSSETTDANASDAAAAGDGAAAAGDGAADASGDLTTIPADATASDAGSTE